ncbi:glycosyltransferase [Candidatus Uhrbacteria bacterium]|nr:glycosyltransferase [Candidatus Uhrbacteria bacterium]
MKIIVAHKYYYEKAGAERYVFDSIKLLENSGHEVIPFAMHHPKNKQTPWSKYFVSYSDFLHSSFFEKFRIPFRMIYSWEAKKKFRALVKETKPDIVHIHNIYHHISPSILDVCREYGIPVVQTIHDYKMICPNYMLFSNGNIDESCKGGAYWHDVLNRSVKHSYVKSALAALEMHIHHALLKIYEKNVQIFIMPSHFVLEKFFEFGVPKEKMIYLPYPMDVNFDSRTIRRSANGNEIHIRDSSPRHPPTGGGGSARNDSERPTILAFGRLSEEKGFDVLIRAMRDVDAHVDIIGDGPLRKKLEALVRSEGVSEKVTLHGFLPRQRIFEYMKHSACVVVPSLWYEVLPYAILESYAHGTAVIASNIGGMKELVGHVNPEYLFAPGESADCARSIAAALMHPDAAADAGEKGRLYVRKECDPNIHIQKLLDIYARRMRKPLPLDKDRERA